MKLAIIIPFYNEEKLIGKTLASFGNLLRYLPDSFFVLMDNNSDDDSLAVINDFFRRSPGLKFHLFNEKRQGVNFSRKTALRKAAELGADLILSTDADTTLPKAYVPVLLKKLAQFIENPADALTANCLAPTNIYLKRLVFFEKFVYFNRVLWSLYAKLFGDYFFGAFFVIKTDTYLKVDRYYNSEDSPLVVDVRGEDLLLSRRVYYTGGSIHWDPDFHLFTSPRRFLNDPLGWFIGGGGKGNFRDNRKGNINAFFKNLAQHVHQHEEELIRQLYINTCSRYWATFLDACQFDQATQLKFLRTQKVMKNFADFFNISIGPVGKMNIGKIEKLFYQRSPEIIHHYLFKNDRSKEKKQ